MAHGRLVVLIRRDERDRLAGKFHQSVGQRGIPDLLRQPALVQSSIDSGLRSEAGPYRVAETRALADVGVQPASGRQPKVVYVRIAGCRQVGQPGQGDVGLNRRNDGRAGRRQDPGPELQGLSGRQQHPRVGKELPVRADRRLGSGVDQAHQVAA